jgi:type I restriction enzyme S subunit
MRSYPLTRWETVRFGDIVAHSAFGPRFSSEAYAADGNVAALRTTDIDNHGRISYETMPLAQLNEDAFASHILRRNDMVITRSGTCGIAAIFEDFPRPVLPGAFLIRFRLNEHAEPYFFRYYFNSPAGRTHILSVARGAVQQNLNITNVEELRVPLPPLEEQKRIVSTLSAYDDLIENNRRRMQLLEESARLLYQEWFVLLRFPGHEHTLIASGIPKGWKEPKAYDALEILGGGTPKTSTPEFWDGDIPFYTPKDATGTIWVTHCERSVTEVGLNNCSSTLFPRGTVFISARGTVGKLNMAQRPMAMSQSCYALVGKNQLPQTFVFCAVQEAVKALRQQASGAVFDAIIVDTFKRISIPVPETKLVRLFDEAAQPIFTQIENLTLQNHKLREARDLLLPRLMSGEISP